ncbi:MAG TPA: sugar phosphate isomerase/epimerase family protein [Clostridia bacterium]
MMKQGFSGFSFSSDYKYEDIFRACSDAGYQGVEVVVQEAGDITLNTGKADLLEIKKMAADYGLEICSIGCTMFWNEPICSNDPKVRNRVIELGKKVLDIGAFLGADTMLLIPGWTGTDFNPNAEIISYDAAYENAKEAISRLGEHAKAVKVAVGIENVWNKFLLSPLEMRNLIDEINNDYVGAYFDVSNILYTGYPDQWIRILGKRIKKIHIADFRRSAISMAGFVDLLAGDVDFGAVMAALRDINYNDYLILEMFPNYTKFPLQSIYSNKPSFDKIMTL